MFSEIRASKERKITINLPDDDNPSNEKGVDYPLILDIICISLDWLANGAFGPFAESVTVCSSPLLQMQVDFSVWLCMDRTHR